MCSEVEEGAQHLRRACVALVGWCNWTCVREGARSEQTHVEYVLVSSNVAVVRVEVQRELRRRTLAV